MIEKEIYDDLRELFVLMASNKQDFLRPYQLTIEQYDTLLILQRDSGWRMGDLTKKILSDNSKMTRIIDYLQKSGWAERKAHPEDRRAQLVFLTESGEILRDDIKIGHDNMLQSWLSPFTATQKSEMQILLQQFRNHMREQSTKNSAF